MTTSKVETDKCSKCPDEMFVVSGFDSEDGNFYTREICPKCDHERYESDGVVIYEDSSKDSEDFT